MTMIIDQGLEAGLSDYCGLANLVLDEEFAEKEKEYELQEGKVQELIKGLPVVIREEIDKSLVGMSEIFVMERHDGARKMADILIRCYVRHHLRLDV
jgi:hypothetical protein